MRVAYVSVDPGIPAFGTKGASVHVQEIIRQFRTRGDQVALFTTALGQQCPDDLADLAVSHVQVDPMQDGRGKRIKDPAKREQAQQRAAAAISDAVQAWGPDLIYERYSLFSTVIADLAPTRSVLEVNAPLIDEQATHRDLVNRDAAELALFAQATAASVVTCVSEPVRDWVQQRTGGRAHAIAVPNGVSVTRILPVGEPTEPVVTFVGTLKPWHGTLTLLQAQQMSRAGWKVRIIGDGPERQMLEDYAAAHNLAVDFRGAVAPADVPAHLAGSALGVAPYPLTDRPEEQYFSPLKVYEYLAAGMPVVASRVGQLPRVVDHGRTGILVAPSDPRALAEAIDALVEDPQRRREMAAAARSDAEQHHSWSSVLDRVLQEVT